MARTQFTFTFTNAQPGAAVSFLSTPVFADASTSVPDGPTLVLSAGGVVSVWADAEALVAYTVDGNGLVLSATATATAPSVTSADGTPGQNPFGAAVESVVAGSGISVDATDPANPVVAATGGTEYVREFLFTEQATADNESYPLLSTSLADQTLTIAGDHTARFYAGFFFYVTGSGILNAADPNVVAASSFDGTNTVITVADGIVADSTDDGAVVFGSYRAALVIPARATVRDIHLLPIAGTWAASAQSLNISDTSAGPGSYVAASSIPFQTGDYDPQAVVLAGNFFTLREIGGVYKQAAEGPTKASSSSANNVLINTGSGVRYVADDTLTIEVITGIDPASLPITPTGQLLVRVFLTTSQTPTAATF